ncbi:MAG TPA: MFS transporter [Actinophytocola sp.]|nr:MFS transporter [Actinophytocola sp.]
MDEGAGLRAVLRHRRFRWLTLGRTTGFLGNAIAPIALAFAVLDLTGSVTDLGVVVGLRSVAAVGLILVGGVLADRLPRAVLLQGAALAAAASAALLAVAVLGGFATIPLLAAIGVVNGAVAAMSLPAAYSITPETVPASMLQAANAIVRIGTNTGAIVGASAGGLLVAVIGPGGAMVVVASVFLGEAACFVAVRGGARPVPRPRAHPLAELREGWAEFVRRPWVWIVVLQFMVVNAVVSGGQHVLGPAIADDTFGRTAWGVALAAQTAGAVVGGLIAARWLPDRALLFGVALTAVFAVPLLVLGQFPHLAALVPAMFVAGLAIEQFAVAWDMSLQRNVPGDRLARVYSYDMLGSAAALPAGQIAVGPIAAALGPATTLTWGFVLVVVVTVAAASTRGVRTLRARQS